MVLEIAGKVLEFQSLTGFVKLWCFKSQGMAAVCAVWLKCLAGIVVDAAATLVATLQRCASATSRSVASATTSDRRRPAWTCPAPRSSFQTASRRTASCSHSPPTIATPTRSGSSCGVPCRCRRRRRSEIFRLPLPLLLLLLLLLLVSRVRRRRKPSCNYWPSSPSHPASRILVKLYVWAKGVARIFH